MTNEIDEVVLNNFLYGTNPLQNYVGLIDTRNHEAADNLKSEKQLSKIEIVSASSRATQQLPPPPSHGVGSRPARIV
ncbi:MAG: hypothetical protein ACKPKO_15400, partial [Candidatus Fonsibacter sp.]